MFVLADDPYNPDDTPQKKKKKIEYA